MKLVLACVASLSALALSACSMLGGNEGPAPDSPAARAPAALPPPMAPATVAATPAAPQPEDIPAVSADKVKCIPPYVLQTINKNGAIEPRCVAPTEAPKPN
ncbi:MAG TPA: hypothetical protein PLH23_16635 [Hyphomonadaceae bacterium]|nr:hypothetical protein [Hyphomonadaceae bacterium]HPI49901.1 hypothetical protein [Hyphomonadaceae bacterium]